MRLLLALLIVPATVVFAAFAGVAQGGIPGVDGTAPTCPSVSVAGPPAQTTFTVQDPESGLVSLVVTKSANADTVVPPFTPGTTDPVTVTSTKIDQTLGMGIVFLATNGAGLVTTCKNDYVPPVCPTSETAGPPKQVTFDVQDSPAGLESIVVTRSENADTVVPPFTVGTLSPVVVTSTKINQSQPMVIEMIVEDLADNSAVCTYSDIPSATPRATRTPRISGGPTRAPTPTITATATATPGSPTATPPLAGSPRATRTPVYR